MKERVFRGYVKETLGPTPAERTLEAAEKQVAFDERSDEDQAELMYQIEGLTSERRDFVRSMKKEEESEGTGWTLKRVGTRLVRVPVPTEGKGRTTYAAEAKEATAARLDDIQKQLNALGEIPGLHETYEQKLNKMYFLAKAHRAYEANAFRIQEINQQISEIRERAHLSRGGAIVGATRAQVEKLEVERDRLMRVNDGAMKQERPAMEEKLNKFKADVETLKAAAGKKPTERQKEEMRKLLHSYDELRYELEGFSAYESGGLFRRIEQLRSYADEFAKGRMIEIPSMKELVEEGLDHMRNHQPFLLAGHLGSGKTEIARHMAKMFMIENGVGYDKAKDTDMDEVYNRLEPEVYSGGEEASVYDLIGKLKLVGKASMDPKEIKQRTDKLAEELEAAGIKGVPREKIAELLLGKGDVTETVFNYGPFGRALRDGKPIIIDEVNLIPPEVIGRINDVMLRGVGDPVHLQENGEEALVMKKGFAVLSTCNLGEKYEGIKDVNAAFKSRWVAREVDYPPVGETYDLILTALVRKDRTRLPPNFPAAEFEKLADLAVAAREIQELFSGQTEGQRFMSLATGVRAEKSQLQKGVVSTRDLMRKIIAPWKQKDFKVPLDDIIAKNILASEILARESKDDQKFMAEIFLRRGFFHGWDEDTFRSLGIQSITKREIDALQAAQGTDEYKNADTRFGKLLQGAKDRVSGLKASLLVGNIDLQKRRKTVTRPT